MMSVKIGVFALAVAAALLLHAGDIDTEKKGEIAPVNLLEKIDENIGKEVVFVGYAIEQKGGVAVSCRCFRIHLTGKDEEKVRQYRKLIAKDGISWRKVRVKGILQLWREQGDVGPQSAKPAGDIYVLVDWTFEAL